MNNNTKEMDKILTLAKKLGFLRVRDLLSRGIHSEYLRRLCNKGLLVRMGRGLYRLAGAEVSENITLTAVAKRIPNGVICILSALRFHRIGTQNPSAVWVALKQRAAYPRGKDLPIRIVRFSASSHVSGVENHILDGVPVRITNPAKTVCDCFKYRNKIGLDVALEALKECIRTRKATPADLWKYAKVCRVANVMRPYLEAVE